MKPVPWSPRITPDSRGIIHGCGILETAVAQHRPPARASMRAMSQTRVIPLVPCT